MALCQDSLDELYLYKTTSKDLLIRAIQIESLTSFHVTKMVDGVIKQYELTRTHDVVEDVIVSNVSDPLTGLQARSSTSHWVFDGKPNPADLGRPAPRGWKYPIIVIEYSEPEFENMTVDGSKQMIEHRLSVQCYSRTRQEANELAEECNHILWTTGKSELMKAALELFSCSSLSDVDFIGGNKEYMKGFDYTFKRFD